MDMQHASKLVRLKDIVTFPPVTEEDAAHNRKEKARMQAENPSSRYKKPVKARSGSRGLLPISAATWWNGVKSGRFPRPVRLSPGCTCWRLSDILNLIEQSA